MRPAWIVLLTLSLLPAARAEFRLFLVNGDTEQAAPAVDNLGTVYPGDTAAVHFRLRNMAAGAAVLSYLEVRGTGFGPKNPLALPLTLDSLAAVDFTVTFSAPEFGSYSAIVDSEGISVTLLVTVPAAPPLPPARLTVVLPTPRSAEQGSVLVNLEAPAPRAASGSVTLDFQPAPAGASDPAIVFASGTPTAAFTCDAGSTQCRFGDQQGGLFQTGTTAGVLTFTARLGAAASDQKTVAILPAPVSVASAEGARLPGSLEVRVTGFDNARTAGPLAFTFFDAAGSPIAPGTIRADGGAAFQQLYKTSDAGGTFLLRAVFPVTGDVSQIASFEAGISNSEGATVSPRTRF
jgi:hypothetical protein